MNNVKYYDMMQSAGLNINNISICENIDDEVDSICSIRKPLVLVRGSQLSYEYVVKIISEEEPVFAEGTTKVGVLGDILYKGCSRWLNTWIHEDGYIGGNLYNIHVINFIDMVYKWVMLAQHNPFLDCMVAYTGIRQYPCYFCNFAHVDKRKPKHIKRSMCCTRNDCAHCKELHKHVRNDDVAPTLGNIFEYVHWNYYDMVNLPSNIENSIKLVLHLSNGKVNIYAGTKAQDVYANSGYSQTFKGDSLFYGDSLYKRGLTNVCSSKLIRDCAKQAGLSYSDLELYAKQNLLYIPKDNEITVTKEWIQEQASKDIW